MKCKKLVIETNGTSAGTKIFVDDKQLSCVTRFEFSADVDKMFSTIFIEKSKLDTDGNPIVKPVKIRDPKTEKFVDGTKVQTETLAIEFDRTSDVERR